MKRLYILTLFVMVLAGSIFFLKKRKPTTLASAEGLIVPKEWLKAAEKPLTPTQDTRPGDQTFLTFPEWYLVFSPDEQAQYFKHTTASTFPFMAHTAQIWQSYRIVNDQIKDNFPVNKGYHFMIWVIGTSASAEYSVKAAYETLIGRLTDTHEVLTDEDKFNAKFTQDYVDLIKDKPWYEFDFKTQLKDLWSNTDVFGSNMLRKLERRYILTSELCVKYVYGKLIGMGTQSMYGAALPTTAVVIDSIPVGSDLKAEKTFRDGSVMVFLPRYDKFNPAVCELVDKNVNFKEIAGNNSAILLSVLAPAGMHKEFLGSKTVFNQPFASDPGIQRIVIAVPVAELSLVLRQLRTAGITIEHVFDF